MLPRIVHCIGYKNVYRSYRSFTTLSLTDLMSRLDNAGSSKDDNAVIELWELAETSNLTENNDCSRNFLHWFSSLGQIQYTLDALSSLLPNVTSEDTLKLLSSYCNAQNHIMAREALELLIENEFELTRQHFNVLLTTSGNNGDISGIINILSHMKLYNITLNQDTLSLIFNSLNSYFKLNNYSLTAINISSYINSIESILDNNNSEYILLTYMNWYCLFGDVQNAFNLYEDISFNKKATKSNIIFIKKLAIQQISLLFLNKISLSKAISLTQEIISIHQYDQSLYKYFNTKNDKLIPRQDTARFIFNILINCDRDPDLDLFHVNILNLLLHICYISHDLHNSLYILYEWYYGSGSGSTAVGGKAQPNDITLQYISKLFNMISTKEYSVSIQPRTIDWSIKIYEWLLDTCDMNGEDLTIISSITQHLLRLLINDIDNINYAVYIIKCIKSIIPSFEIDSSIFYILAQNTIGNETQIHIVTERIINVFNCMYELRDNGEMITSVVDRARLLGSILSNYDSNLCNLYDKTIGGNKQSYFQMRRDLQQQIVLKLHRSHPLHDILTLDVVKLTRTTVNVNHTTALTDSPTKFESGLNK